jgi:ribosomal protein S12 methylthiotransferase accessory factor YcaO
MTGASHVELDRALTARLPELGITRLANTTGLDRLGIHTHSCVRPGTSDDIWVYSGKGLSAEASRVSAIMECVERTSALWKQEAVTIAPRARLVGWPVFGPECFTESSRPADERPEAWVLAHRLRGGRAWVPAELVFLGHSKSDHVNLRFAVRTSNGLGAGFTRDGALAHALEELIERDVVSCAELRASHAGSAMLAGFARAAGLDVAAIMASFRDDVDVAVTVDPASLPEPAAGLVRRFAAIGVAITIKYIPNDLGIPVFGAAAIEQLSFDSVLATAGFAASHDSVQAVSRAILELAQSRATDRQGAREDCGRDEKGRHSTIPTNHWLATPGRAVDLASLPWGAIAANRIAHDAKVLAAVGLDEVLFYPFDAPAGTHVVRALVPGIETWHATAGHSRLGPRMQRVLGGIG